MFENTVSRFNGSKSFDIHAFQKYSDPHDGSKYSIHAFNIALDMAQRYDSKLTILTSPQTCLPWNLVL